jgi:hypothetical protein
LRLRGLCEGVLLGDLDSVDLAEAFPGVILDAVVLRDVLAYVLHPAELLRRVTKVLTADCRLVASFPNATYAARRIRFWQGVGHEEEVGPGRSLVRAFTLERVEQLLSENGLSAVERLPMRRPAGDGPDLTLPAAVRDFLSADEDADIDHWLVVASPAAGPRVAPASLTEELQRRVHRAQDEAAVLRNDLADLEQELATLQLDLAIKDDFALELRGKLQTAERNATRVESDLQQTRAELNQANEQLLAAERELDDLRPLAGKPLSALLLDRIMKRSAGRSQPGTPPRP